MLYRTLKRMIEKGKTAGMAKKLDIPDKLSEEEYTELVAMLEPKEETDHAG